MDFCVLKIEMGPDGSGNVEDEEMRLFLCAAQVAIALMLCFCSTPLFAGFALQCVSVH